jgi:superfamily II DNA or RNA helicase
MELRPYQMKAINKINMSTNKSILLVAPCGAGKTIMMVALAKSSPSLFLVHRNELKVNLEETLKKHGVYNSRVFMVQTLRNQIKKGNVTFKPELIITDEAHHCLASSYKKVYEYFSTCKNIGVTATPTRLDGTGLGEIYQELIDTVTVEYLVNNKYLSNYRYFSLPVINREDLEVVNGEFTTKSINAVYEKTETAFDTILHNYRLYGESRKAICYCANIELSKQVSTMFRQNNINSHHVGAETPKQERDDIMRDFKSGLVTILCNVDIVSEGFDVPECDVVILLRPTMSLSLHIQQSMRCMRPNGDSVAIILDHVGNYTKHGTPLTPQDWSLERNKPKVNTGLKECGSCYMVYTHLGIDTDAFTKALPHFKINNSNLCPFCGYVQPIKERKIKELEVADFTELVEIANYFKPEPRNYKECNTILEMALLTLRLDNTKRVLLNNIKKHRLEWQDLNEKSYVQKLKFRGD